MALESLRTLIFSVFRTVFPKMFPRNRFLTFLINIRKAGRTAADYGIVLVGILRQCLTDSRGPQSGLQSILCDRWGQRTVSEHVSVHETRREVFEALQDAIPPSHEANMSDLGCSSDWPTVMAITHEETARGETTQRTPSLASWMSDSDSSWRPGSVDSDAEESQDEYYKPRKHKRGSHPAQPGPQVNPEQGTNSVASPNRSIWNQGRVSSNIGNTSENQCQQTYSLSDLESGLESEFSDDDIGIEHAPLALPTRGRLRGSLDISAVLERMKSINMSDEEDIQRRVTATLTPFQLHAATLS